MSLTTISEIKNKEAIESEEIQRNTRQASSGDRPSEGKTMCVGQMYLL